MSAETPLDALARLEKKLIPEHYPVFGMAGGTQMEADAQDRWQAKYGKDAADIRAIRRALSVTPQGNGDSPCAIATSGNHEWEHGPYARGIGMHCRWCDVRGVIVVDPRDRGPLIPPVTPQRAEAAEPTVRMKWLVPSEVVPSGTEEMGNAGSNPEEKP